jgi:hypothetical protein
MKVVEHGPQRVVLREWSFETLALLGRWIVGASLLSVLMGVVLAWLALGWGHLDCSRPRGECALTVSSIFRTHEERWGIDELKSVEPEKYGGRFRRLFFHFRGGDRVFFPAGFESTATMREQALEINHFLAEPTLPALTVDLRWQVSAALAPAVFLLLGLVALLWWLVPTRTRWSFDRASNTAEAESRWLFWKDRHISRPLSDVQRLVFTRKPDAAEYLFWLCLPPPRDRDLLIVYAPWPAEGIAQARRALEEMGLTVEPDEGTP